MKQVDTAHIRALVKDVMRTIKEANKTPHSMALEVADDAMLALATKYPELLALLDEVDSLRQQVPDDAEFLGLHAVVSDDMDTMSDDACNAACRYIDRVERLRKAAKRAKS